MNKQNFNIIPVISYFSVDKHTGGKDKIRRDEVIELVRNSGFYDDINEAMMALDQGGVLHTDYATYHREIRMEPQSVEKKSTV